MPIYEYRCRSCGARFEALVSPPDRAHGPEVETNPPCTHCGAGPANGRPAERLLSTFAVGRPRAAARTQGPCGSDDCACHGG